MALELYPTPSWPRPAFSIPFAGEHKRFPQLEEMAARPLAPLNPEDSEGDSVISYWASDRECLYVAVVASGPVDPTRERAWRHGDGLLLTISLQSDDQPVQNYTSLGIAGTSKKPQILGIHHSGVWYPKLDCSKLKYKFQQDKDNARFSVTIPWSVLEPLRPLLYETIALNLTFTRQREAGRSIYQLTPDANYCSEAAQWRSLLPVSFAYNISRPLAQSYLTRNCWRGDEPLQINLGLYNPETCPARLDLVIKEGDTTLEAHSSSAELAPGSHHWTLRWSPQRSLPTGKYTLELSGHGNGRSYKKRHEIFVLNPDELTSLRNELLSWEEDINCLYPGAIHTALAKLEWLEGGLAKCSWQEPDFSGFAAAQSILEDLRKGVNPIPDKAGLSRRAFRSPVDGSLQAYSLYLPKGYSSEHKWPLLMLLHDSCGDEQHLAADPELHKLADRLGLILLFPCARTACGFYLNQDETDILYNLAILKKRLPLDWDKLFLGGLARGGFGAWHTGLRHPGHFAGLAIISGVPSLPLAGEDYALNYDFNPVDFSENAKKLSLLVVHDARDCAVPVESVREVIKGLHEKGVELTYRENAAGGHSDFDWHSPLAAWLKANLKK